MDFPSLFHKYRVSTSLLICAARPSCTSPLQTEAAVRSERKADSKYYPITGVADLTNKCFSVQCLCAGTRRHDATCCRRDRTSARGEELSVGIVTSHRHSTEQVSKKRNSLETRLSHTDISYRYITHDFAESKYQKTFRTKAPAHQVQSLEPSCPLTC
jgi:hypothetical protein